MFTVRPAHEKYAQLIENVYHTPLCPKVSLLNITHLQTQSLRQLALVEDMDWRSCIKRSTSITPHCLKRRALRQLMLIEDADLAV